MNWKKFKDKNVIYDEGIKAFKQYDFKKAVKIFLKVVEIDANDYKALYNIAYSYVMLRDYRKAVDYYKKFQKIVPTEQDGEDFKSLFREVEKATLVSQDEGDKIINACLADEFKVYREVTQNKTPFKGLNTKITAGNAEEYYKMVAQLYLKGEYNEALKGFKKLSKYSENSRIYSIPFIERCEKVLKREVSDEDIRHKSNQYVLKNFNWLNKLAIGTGIIAFIALVGGGFTGITLAIIFGLITFLICLKMNKFNSSKDLVRCKYCGHYTSYINPNEPTFGFANTNSCEHCGRMYAMPTLQWDCWEGLDYMEKRHSVPDKEFYSEYNKLKEKYSKEYKVLFSEGVEK